MANYSYIAVDPRGSETRGMLEVANQGEAVRRVREMGLFPTKIKAASERAVRRAILSHPPDRAAQPTRGRVKSIRLVVFTRQMATLIGAGMSLLRSLRIQ